MALLTAIFHAVFYFWAAANLMVYMLADTYVTVDELFAVGATFTLVAWGFAYVFTVLQMLQPGCFTAAVNPTDQRTWVELLFLSFTNLSSTGLSDIVPITAHARSVVMIEQLAGLGVRGAVRVQAGGADPGSEHPRRGPESLTQRQTSRSSKTSKVAPPVAKFARSPAAAPPSAELSAACRSAIVSQLRVATR